MNFADHYLVIIWYIFFFNKSLSEIREMTSTLQKFSYTAC
jgi:hypothetical protein